MTFHHPRLRRFIAQVMFLLGMRTVRRYKPAVSRERGNWEGKR